MQTLGGGLVCGAGAAAAAAAMRPAPFSSSLRQATRESTGMGAAGGPGGSTSQAGAEGQQQ